MTKILYHKDVTDFRAEIPTDHQSAIISTALKSQLWVGNTGMFTIAFSCAWLVQFKFT